MEHPRDLFENSPRINNQRKDIEVASSSAHHVDVERVIEVASDPGAGGEVQLLTYWRPVRKHLWLIIGIVTLATAAAFVYVTLKPDIYQAQAAVQVDLENTAAIGFSKNGAVVSPNSANDPAYFNTQLQLLTRPALLRRIVKTLDLESNPAFRRLQSDALSTSQPGGRVGNDQTAEKNLAERALANSQPQSMSREDLAEAERLAPYVEALQRGLEVEPVKEMRLANEETRLINIQFTHTNPQVTAKVVNAIADELVRSNLEKKTETSNAAGDFLQKRIAEMQAQIRNGEERLINYARNHQILSLDASQNMVVERLAGLNRQLLEAENERKLAEASYRAALAPGAASALAEGNAKQLADAETRLGELRQRRAQLLVENTEEWPEVKEVEQQITTLEKQLHDARARATSVVLTNLETRYRQAWARERDLRAAFNQQRGETLTQNEAAINYRIIQQEVDTNKSLLDGLLQRAKENDVLLTWTPNNIRVVDYAITPRTPIAPKRAQGIALAFLMALVASVGLAHFIEYLNTTIRSTADVEKTLQLPALAAIPSIASLPRRRLLSGAVSRWRNGNQRPELLLNAEGFSPLAEAYRRLRTFVLMSMGGHASKTLLVTSSQPAEGKTTTVVNMALVLAQTGASVLVLDADLRRPTLHSIFGLDNDTGLSNLLVSDMSSVEVFGAIRQHGQIDNLYLCTAGPIPSNPAELLGAKQMGRLLTLLESNFTYIIIDSPPIGLYTDAVLIASIVDGVLLVVQEGKSPRELVRRARNDLQDVGAKIFGVVLNNVDTQSPESYYRNYYPHG